MSFRKLRQAALEGNAEAQYQLAALFATGDDQTPKDLEEARHWYERSAAQGHPEALYNLGFMYILGETVTADAKRGLSLLEKAADYGSKDAQFLYADILLYGYYNVPRNSTRGIILHLESLRNGNARSAFSIALALKKGAIAKKELIYALIKFAADNSVRPAAEMMRRLYDK